LTGRGDGRRVRALVCRSLTPDLSGLALEELPLPDLAPGHVEVVVRACALNFPDVLMTQGRYQFRPPLPFVPGIEAVGEVVAVGAGVLGRAPGERVLIALPCGGLAERVVVPAAALRPAPARLDDVKAAAYPVASLTAYVSLVRRGDLQRGEVLLVHGAAGGVGLAAVELGKLLGATVIATASTAAKREVVRARGADHVLAPSGFREGVKELTGGRGADVVYDPVGGDVFDESTRCIAWHGRLLVVGFASGRIPTIAANLSLIKGFSVIGVRAGEDGRRDPVQGRENVAQIDRWAQEGKVDPYVSATFPLAQSLAALRMLHERAAIGKVVVTMA